MVIGLIFFSSEELDNWTKCMKKLQTWDNRKHRSVMLERRKIYFERKSETRQKHKHTDEVTQKSVSEFLLAWV